MGRQRVCQVNGVCLEASHKSQSPRNEKALRVPRSATSTQQMQGRVVSGSPSCILPSPNPVADPLSVLRTGWISTGLFTGVGRDKRSDRERTLFEDHFSLLIFLLEQHKAVDRSISSFLKVLFSYQFKIKASSPLQLTTNRDLCCLVFCPTERTSFFCTLPSHVPRWFSIQAALCRPQKSHCCWQCTRHVGHFIRGSRALWTRPQWAGCLPGWERHVVDQCLTLHAREGGGTPRGPGFLQGQLLGKRTHSPWLWPVPQVLLLSQSRAHSLLLPHL